MIGTYSPQLECIAKRNSCARKLRNSSKEELTKLLKDYIKKHGKEEIDFVSLCVKPNNDNVFMAAGAADVLRERHGQNYVSNITGVGPAKTLKEKIIYFLTGKLFPYKRD